MQRKTLLLVLLAALVATSGCSGLSDSGTTHPNVDAAAVQSQALSAMENTSTYEYNLTGTQHVNGITVDLQSSGVVNRDQKRMHTEATATATQGDQSNTVTTETYVVDDTQYVHQQGVWQTKQLSRDIWSQNALGRQRAILDGANVSVVNTTTVEGVETYAIAVDPGESSLENYVKSRSNVNGNVSVDDVHIVQYVAVDTHRLRKVSLEMSVSVNGRTVDQHFTITYHDYGTETDIEVPDEATN